MTEAAATPQVDEIVAKYIALRDKKAVFKAEYEAKVGAIDAALAKIERHLLTQMQAQGLKAMPTEAGTAYIQHRTSASVADWDTLLPWIMAGQHLNMLEKRISKSAIEEYRQEHEGDMPPGINWSESVVVNVKRS